MANKQPLQSPRRAIQGRESDQFLLDSLPFGQGIDKEAMIAIHGHHNLAGAALNELVTVAAGKCHPPLHVQINLGDAAKHPGPLSSPSAPFITTLSHFFPQYKFSKTQRQAIQFKNITYITKAYIYYCMRYSNMQDQSIKLIRNNKLKGGRFKVEKCNCMI
jgi:hypothetical protein